MLPAREQRDRVMDRPLRMQTVVPAHGFTEDCWIGRPFDVVENGFGWLEFWFLRTLRDVKSPSFEKLQ